jgi:hypothetical protein
MERVEGVIVSFVANPRFGNARCKNNKKVFLPGASMRKELNGKWHHFESGEERPFPPLNAKIIMDICPDGKGEYIANNWAIKP